MRVLAIQNYGSSGSMFVQSLLDGHPDCLSTPALHSYHFFRDWKNLLAHSPDPVEAFLTSVEHYFHLPNWWTPWGLAELGPNRNETPEIDKTSFRTALLRFLPVDQPLSRRDLFVAQYRAYRFALGGDVSAASLIVFPIHSHSREIVADLLEDFPETRFLYTVREPIQNIGSHLKNIEMARQTCNIAEAVLLTMTMGFSIEHNQSRFCFSDRPYPEVMRQRCRAIRLEDLHASPKQTLTRLCDWLQIDWDDCLLHSTFNGKTWWNRPGSTRVSGFSKAIVKKDHSDIISPFDRWRFRELFSTKLRVWKYSSSDSVSKRPNAIHYLIALLWPFQIEFRAWGSRRKHVSRVIRRQRMVGARSRRRFIGAKLMNQLAFHLSIAACCLYFVVRDFVAIRKVLWQAWLQNRKPSQEVDLL